MRRWEGPLLALLLVAGILFLALLLVAANSPNPVIGGVAVALLGALLILTRWELAEVLNALNWPRLPVRLSAAILATFGVIAIVAGIVQAL